MTLLARDDHYVLVNRDHEVVALVVRSNEAGKWQVIKASGETVYNYLPLDSAIREATRVAETETKNPDQPDEGWPGVGASCGPDGACHGGFVSRGSCVGGDDDD